MEHHAIIITGTQPGKLNREEMLVYTLIVGRVLENVHAALQGGIHNRRCGVCRT